MSMRGILFALVASMAMAGYSTASQATVFNSPNPAVFGNDIDGTGLFNFGQPTFAVELYDLGDLVVGSGFEFGFYFDGNWGNRTVIFDAADITTGAPTHSAEINFATGTVNDLDAGVVQDTFTFQPGAGIGFYLYSPQLLGITDPIFTQAILNPGGTDLAGTFPLLGQQFRYLIGFFNGNNELLSADLLAPVAPLAPVPVPGALGLWLLGMAGLGLFRRRLKSQQV